MELTTSKMHWYDKCKGYGDLKFTIHVASLYKGRDNHQKVATLFRKIFMLRVHLHV